MNITKDLLYFFNSTYRNPIRPIEVIKKLSIYNNDHLQVKSLINVETITNEDVKLKSTHTAEISHQSYGRKKSELHRLDFLKIGKNGEIIELINIHNLKPLPQQFKIDFDIEGEWNSNIMLFGLSKAKHLEFMYSLITYVDKIWLAQSGHRQGVSELELIYLYCYLDKYTNASIENLASLVINLRNNYKNQLVVKKGHEKDYVRKQILSDFSQTKLNTGSDYIDSLMRTFALTQCFQITRHGMNKNNVFAMKLLSINHTFKDKIDFFISNSYEQVTNYVKDNTFCNRLYTAFDALKAYNQQHDEINIVIKNNPHHFLLLDKWEENKHSWFQYEYYCSLYALQQIKQHDINYDNYTKKVAIKIFDKIPYGGTTPSMADSYTVMNDMVLTVESSTLMNEYQQCHKEYVQSVEHLLKHMNEHNKVKGLAIIVMPNITHKFNNYCIKHNYSNSLGLESEKTLLIALTTQQYVHFIKNINTEDKLLKFMDYMVRVDYNAYIDHHEIFYTLFLNYLSGEQKYDHNQVKKGNNDYLLYKELMNQLNNNLMSNLKVSYTSVNNSMLSIH